MILPVLKSLFPVLALTAALAPGGAVPALAEAGSGAPAGRGHAAIGAGPARALVPVASLAALKYANLVRQRFDYSCGAAALATLLTYGYGHTVGEMDIIDK